MLSVNHDIVPTFVGIIEPLSLSYAEKGGQHIPNTRQKISARQHNIISRKALFLNITTL
jgi:hypothetical protein